MMIIVVITAVGVPCEVNNEHWLIILIQMMILNWAK